MAIMDDKVRWISGPAYDYGTNDAGYYQAHRNHVLSRTFVVDTHAEALLKIAVLGYARVLINGQPLGNIELLGDWTNYTSTGSPWATSSFWGTGPTTPSSSMCAPST